MNADVAFAKGKIHLVCQDYAAAEVTESGVTVLVSDGCSGSPHTDFGARILTQCALINLPLLKAWPVSQAVALATGDDAVVAEDDPDAPVDTVVNGNMDSCEIPAQTYEANREAFLTTTLHDASNTIRALKLRPQCLDATLIILRADETSYHAEVYGDGAIVVGYADGSMRVTLVDYPSNFPEYLSYRLDENRMQRYEAILQNDCEKEQRQGPILVTTFRIPKAADTPEAARQNPRHAQEIEERYLERGEVIIVAGNCKGGTTTAEDVRWVAALSDGLQTFHQIIPEGGAKVRVPIALEAVLIALLDFRSMNGQFVQRQFQWFLREAARRGWMHDDDLSVGVVEVAS